MVGPRVSGGIFDNVVAQGSLRFFKLSSAALGYFAHTTSTGSTLVPGGTGVVLEIGKPVPGSVADRVFRTIMENCTVVLISVIDDNNIHFICENLGFAWGTPAIGGGSAGQGGSGVAATEILAAIKALGVIGGGAIGSLDSPIPDATATGVPSRDLNVGGVTLVEVDFDIVT